ncbi:hypothetical protein CVT26_005324 [Gymnopilus dilepis]|uniref:Uncharacterized protein n=1 Tax=Gymnopilus dilepis TaxID=231916 RepID=A0A409WJ74_9AGAR|nr:hypothetical protein CVT26_005324 [Gymnopilus dilepis]
MFFRPTSFFLLLLALWVAIFALAVITAIALIASTSCANCQSAFGNEDSVAHTGFYVTNEDADTTLERISAFVYEHSSYFQSVHITLFQAVATCCLAISPPSLWAMIWSRLDYSAETIRKPMTMTVLQDSINMAQSKSLASAFSYTISSGSLARPVLFVILIAILSRGAPLAISPIYKPHEGPYLVNASVLVGGGTGISTYGLSYDLNDVIPGGLESGRALLAARSYLSIDIIPTVYDIGVAPFLFQDAVQAIWNARIKTAVARNTLDCSSSALSRLWNTTNANSTQDVVVLDINYFSPSLAPSHELGYLVAGYEVQGYLTNEPEVTPTYLNTSLTNTTSSVTAVTSVVFLAANGTMEGAQQTITAPNSPSWISSVDVLICTSDTTLEVSYCTIDRGQVTNCSPSNTDDLEKYVQHPLTVATILAASPVTAYYHIADLLPIYDINPQIIASQLPPLPYLTANAQIDSYYIPLNYTQNVLFRQTAQAITQGLVNAYAFPQPQNLQITVTFGTSQPILSSIIMAVALACALAATLLNISQREVRALDMARLLAISRNPELDVLLAPYSARNKEMGEDVMEATVVCHNDEGQHVLVLDMVTTDDVSASGEAESLIANDCELGHVPLLRGRHPEPVGRSKGRLAGEDAWDVEGVGWSTMSELEGVAKDECWLTSWRVTGHRQDRRKSSPCTTANDLSTSVLF